jgi:uncharacterized oxidoreductase
VRGLQAGRVNPRAEIRVVRETASTAILDCDFAFGQVAGTRGIETAMAKAREHDIGMVVLQRCGHVGRLGEYVVMAAEQGYIGLMICNGPSPRGGVAPYGGIGRALGTNPIAWGIPASLVADSPDRSGKPLFLDYATSCCAHGKIQVAADKGLPVPEGWMLDKSGQPTTDPQDQFDGGVLLPFGGHKGYGLGVVVELLGGGLSGAEPSVLRSNKEYAQGTVQIAINVEAFRPLDDYRAMVSRFAERVKQVPRAPGCDEILVPGEPEWRCKAQRERDGIPLPEKTWDRIGETATALGLHWDGTPSA